MTAIIARDNKIGTQFHPEKSQKAVLNLISEFINWHIYMSEEIINVDKNRSLY